jgi:hypothetical protein
LEDDHGLRTCETCSEIIPESQIVEHKVTRHSWRHCPFCQDGFSVSDLYQHIVWEHSKCSQCDFVGLSREMAAHMAEEHSTKRCLICDAMVHATQWEDHSASCRSSSLIKCEFCRKRKKKVRTFRTIETYRPLTEVVYP